MTSHVFQHTDHAGDDIFGYPKIDCEACPPGTIALNTGGSSVHLPPAEQHDLIEWLRVNLAEYGQDTESAPPTFEPGGYLFDVEVGDAKISISDGVNLDAFQMSALIRAATEGLGRAVNGDGAESDSAHALFLEQLTEAMGLGGETSPERIISAASNLLSETRALAYRVDKQEAAIQQLHDQRGQLMRDRDSAQARLRNTVQTINEITQRLERAPKSAVSGDGTLPDRVRALVEAAQHLADVRNELAKYAPVGPPSGDAAALRHLLQTQRETIAALRDQVSAATEVKADLERALIESEGLLIKRAGRVLVLEHALRELRAEFTNTDGMPVDVELNAEHAAAIVQRIDKALEA